MRFRDNSLGFGASAMCASSRHVISPQPANNCGKEWLGIPGSLTKHDIFLVVTAARGGYVYVSYAFLCKFTISMNKDYPVSVQIYTPNLIHATHILNKQV